MARNTPAMIASMTAAMTISIMPSSADSVGKPGYAGILNRNARSSVAQRRAPLMPFDPEDGRTGAERAPLPPFGD
jgi:hypothetical protein